MSYAESIVVCRSLHDPSLDEGLCVGLEEAACVGVSGRRDRSFFRHALADNEFEATVRRLRDAEHRDRPFLDLELDGCASSGLSVIFLEASEHRLTLCNSEVMRSVVTDEDEVLRKVEGVEFGKASADSESVHDQHRDAAFNVISAVIRAFSFIAVLVTLSPWAPIIVILSAVPGAIVNFYFRNKNFRYIRFHSKERRQMNYYSGLMVNKDRVKEIKILGLGETFISKYKTVFAKYYKGLKKIIVREGIVQIAVGLLTTLISSVLFVYVAFTVINGDGLVGDYSLYSGALTSITTYVGTLLASTVTIYEGTLFIDNMITFMKEEPKIVPTVAEPLKVERGIPHKIEIKNVSFAYPGTERMVLKNLNLTIEANDSIVLVGLNGAGKTTLIKLLTRLYDPTEGEILLDGHSLKEYDPVSLYSAFGIIFQDFGHYAETVSENVRFGDIDREYDEEEIHLAAKRGGAESFINRLPYGYNTPLTRMFEKNGIEPSGGQWQKLSVARAFYTDSEILIMDEPTASLDPIAEREVFDQYALLAKNKISVFVSHKLSSAVNATKIVVIDDGRIVEVGSHDELMRLGGSYCNLFTIQAQRYAGVTAPADAE